MRFPRPTWGAAIALFIVLLLGAGVYWRVQGEGAEDEAVAENSADLPAVSATETFDAGIPTPVEAETVVKDTLIISVNADGQAEPWRTTRLLAQVSGQIEAIAVREGDGVESGSALIRIDPTEYQLSLEEAQATRRRAQADYQSMILGDERQIDDPELRAERQEVARARSGLETAEIGVRRAQLELERTVVRAPFGGRIEDLAVVPGQFVRTGDELLTVAALDPIRVEVYALESEAPYLQRGGAAELMFNAFPGEVITGRIHSINPRAGENRHVRATVVVPNPGGRILPGMFADVSLDAQRFPDRLLVPTSAILERDGRTMVFVYQENETGGAGTAQWVYVTTGLQNDHQTEIVPDPQHPTQLEPGQVVLTAGHTLLEHQTAVRVVENAAAEGGRPD